MNSYLKYSLKLETLFLLRIEVLVNSTTCSLRLVYHNFKFLAQTHFHFSWVRGLDFSWIGHMSFWAFVSYNYSRMLRNFCNDKKKKFSWVWINMMPNNLKSLLINFWTKLLSYKCWENVFKSFCWSWRAPNWIDVISNETRPRTTVISTMKLRDLSSSSSCSIYTPTGRYK